MTITAGRAHREGHRTERIGWLRAAVLGANDGIVSNASLLVGIAATDPGPGQLIMTGIAGLVAGAMSMAAGEYVSVSSQSDSERADLGRERAELATQPGVELQELTSIYEARGLPRGLAAEVAQALTTHDALAAHARDELGVSAATTARPLQAALASALSFAVGAVLPLLVVLVAPTRLVLPLVSGASLAFLCGLGAVSARAGGAPVLRASLRVTLLGALAMGLTSLAGRLFGAAL